MKIKLLITIISFCYCFQAISQVRLSALFTDQMVLQQQRRVPIWGWGTPKERITVVTSWDNKEYAGEVSEDGTWKLYINTPKAGGPFKITITQKTSLVLTDVLIGEVWLCSGQSNMEMPLKGYPGQPIIGSTEAILGSTNDKLRFYTVPRNPVLKPAVDSKPGSWKTANPENVANFSATAYFFGKRIYEVLEVPIGLILSAYGGSNVEAWMEQSWLSDMEGLEVPKTEEGLKDKNRVPTMLYNGMIHPIAEFGIRGMIWYQGESNYEREGSYDLLFPKMVEEYRKLWKQENLPFYFTQIAPFDYKSLPPHHAGEKFNSAYLRDAQRKSLNKIKYSGMAVTLDLGEENCIHPAHKREVGDRLALLALGDAYGTKGIFYRSPSYEKIEIIDGQIKVSFTEAPLGLTTFGKPLRSFEIAGEDRMFYSAEAKIVGKQVVVSSEQVKNPVAVRYAFKDFVIGDLFGVNGLPVGSFRSDDW
ncbi:sialate O-acetylesterase [Sphingobacterium lactis]|uniref:Sialate O-acetylesterase n=1 Tax=Sphingobacterium lactis TaxID=797291 RepID=A0A1H6C5B9_9SPHI|nr:sialate O-acetylesterase [Sphingobacterium lactis]SEG68180.1 sialate O-acetylesterase [Sphingobacterium lactis]